MDCSHGDLRELVLDRKFPLITGSPPYFPHGTGVLPQDSQKAHARFELRGDVSDYAKAAVSHLAEGGWFVLCFPSPQKQRALDGIAASGLKVVKLRDVIPRETLPPLFTLFACQLPQDFSGEVTVEEPLTVRHADGRLTVQGGVALGRRGKVPVAKCQPLVRTTEVGLGKVPVTYPASGSRPWQSASHLSGQRE